MRQLWFPRSVLALFFLFTPISGFGESRIIEIKHFRQSKRLLAEIHSENPTTIYCNCTYKGKEVDFKSCGYKPRNIKRARTIEWEHVVPAETFGASFEEWKNGSPKCVRKKKRYKGRKCAKTNPKFSKIEADPHNLWPSVGEINGVRKNYAMAEITSKSSSVSFGACNVKIDNHKFEPPSTAKGRIARTYFYMEQTYPDVVRLSDKNRKLFEAWDKLHPVDPWECKRSSKIRELTGKSNSILESRCKNISVLKGLQKNNPKKF